MYILYQNLFAIYQIQLSVMKRHAYVENKREYVLSNVYTSRPGLCSSFKRGSLRPMSTHSLELKTATRTNDN